MTQAGLSGELDAKKKNSAPALTRYLAKLRKEEEWNALCQKKNHEKECEPTSFMR
jgi:hypothetical protein